MRNSSCTMKTTGTRSSQTLPRTSTYANTKTWSPPSTPYFSSSWAEERRDSTPRGRAHDEDVCSRAMGVRRKNQIEGVSHFHHRAADLHDRYGTSAELCR